MGTPDARGSEACAFLLWVWVLIRNDGKHEFDVIGRHSRAKDGKPWRFSCDKPYRIDA